MIRKPEHHYDLPIFDEDVAPRARQARATPIAESVPNYLAHVEDARARWPHLWAAAHGNGPQTEDFIRMLGSYLHHDVDPRVGLNGKRLSATDISDDGLALIDAGSPIVDVGTGQHFAFIDCIARAGASDASPSWQNISGTTPSQGRWIQPSRIHDNIGPPPPPPPPPIRSREQFAKDFRVVNAFYGAPDGLQRVGGMVGGVDASVFKVLELVASGADVDGQTVRDAAQAVLRVQCDVVAMIAWGYELMLSDGSLESVLAEIRKSDEFRAKHGG